MIYIDRNSVPVPARLLERSYKETQKIVAEMSELGAQQRLKFRDEAWRHYRPLLEQLFHGKCAFCESRLLATDLGDFEHFRPKASVEEDPKHPGYYWLAYSWGNHYLTCRVCNINKRNHFPIAGTRAYSIEASLWEEKPLLLDPCRDYPEEHLRFAVEEEQPGMAVGLDERGLATIAVLGLNRAHLVQARAEESEIVRTKLMHFAVNAPLDEIEAEANRLTQPNFPYAAVRREVVSQLLGTFVKRVTDRGRWGIPPADLERLAETDRTAATQLPAVPVLPVSLSSPVAPPSSGTPMPVSSQSSPRTGVISRVKIENFKSIESLDLSFEFAREGHTGWQVFLGENGTGKSSILQALAIALIGQESLDALTLDAARILRLPREEEERPMKGSIQVWLGTDLEPIEVSFDSKEFRYISGAEGANNFVRGYGPTRLMPKRRRAALAVQQAGAAVTAPESEHSSNLKSSVANLFDPYVPLCDAPAWLGQLAGTEFDKVAITLKDVLRFRNEDNLVFDRERGEVKALDASGITVELDLLSHGQQSALVLASDIVSGIMAHRKAAGLDAAPGDFRDCTGIVLLDEIDAHLHPRWKMEIVPSLKRAFPYIQFLATTHEPLCLRGLEEREIVIVRRDGAEVSAEITPISPQGWRVDQLLTSELFGLFSTIDPDVDGEFQEYYWLLSKEPDLDPGERARLEDLRSTLPRHNRLGYTRRDQLLYEVIDEFLVDELRIRSPDVRAQRREETKNKIRDIWRRVVVSRGQDS